MDFGKLIENSFGYSKEGLVGHWGKWIMLIILGILPVIPLWLGIGFGFLAVLTAPVMLIPTIVITLILMLILTFPLLGYTVRIYCGDNPAPEVNNWGSLFADGLKLFIVLLIYAIPVMILVIALVGSVIVVMIPYLPQLVSQLTNSSQLMTIPSTMMGLIGAAIFGVVIIILVALIIWLIEATAVVRFAKTKSIGEAFNFGEIFSRIGKIGVGSYIVALIIQAIIVFVILLILEFIPYIGFILVLIVTPVILLFQARYLNLLYDSVAVETQGPA